MESTECWFEARLKQSSFCNASMRFRHNVAAGHYIGSDSEVVTRAEFEESAAELFGRAMAPVQKARRISRYMCGQSAL